MAIEQSALLLLLNWMSPTFPIGSFAYSHGLEQAIADGRLRTDRDVRLWIDDLLRYGSGWNDAVLFSQCWTLDAESVNEHALALCGSTERYLETTHLGHNFNKAAAVWTGNSTGNGIMAYPVAAAIACRNCGIPQDQSLAAYLQGFAAAMVSVAVRLVPLGQTKGLEILRDLSLTITEVAASAQKATLEDLASSCIMADIAAMKHETLQPRIFRT